MSEDVKKNSTRDTLTLIAFVFSLISTIAVCWLIIPLAWMIPMTVHCWSIYKGRKDISVGFSICELLFVSLVSGILLIVADNE